MIVGIKIIFNFNIFVYFCENLENWQTVKIKAEFTAHCSNYENFESSTVLKYLNEKPQGKSEHRSFSNSQLTDLQSIGDHSETI